MFAEFECLGGRRWAAFIALVTLACTACGSRTSVDADDYVQAGEVDGSPPPYDFRMAPTEVEMTCQEMESNIHLRLPCEVGMSITGEPGKAGVNVLQCDLDFRGPIGTMGLLMPLGEIGTARLHQPVNIETDLKIVPSSNVILDTRTFQLISAGGTLVVDAVDLGGRSFNGRIIDFVSDWIDEVSGKHSLCRLPDGIIWAVPGAFR